MGRAGSKASEVIQRLVEIGTQAFIEQTDLPLAQARATMREVAHLFAREYGGTEVYVPKDQDFVLEKRDLMMFDRVDRGSSTLDIARESGLTQRHVRNIVKHVREQGGGRVRQSTLPGFDDA